MQKLNRPAAALRWTAPFVTRQLRARPVCDKGDLSMTNRALRFIFAGPLFLSPFFLANCGSPMPQGIQQARITAAQNIQAEVPGDYFIGRRYYKIPQYKFWGYVRRPGQPWSTAQLVVFNEKEKLAPDREQLNFGFDNNYEYKLYGRFSGDTVYDAGSNGFYPEFVLKKYELISINPGPIFKSQYSDRARAAVSKLAIEKPE
jgi:hypothetical protein